MDARKKKEFPRVLCKVTGLLSKNQNQIEVSPNVMEALKLQSENSATNHGSAIFKVNPSLHQRYNLKISRQFAQNLGISKDDYIELFKINDIVYLAPISSQKLTDYFYRIEGSSNPRVIVLSSHAEFEPYTREIATAIYSRLRNLSIPSFRIEIRKHYIEWKQKLDATISRYEVDITRKEDYPQFIAKKWVNKNLSYRILAKLYFELLSQYLRPNERRIVIDIHGIATASPKGIMHPMIIVGDALSKNILVKNFTKFIERASRPLIPNLWIIYSSKWGAVEYSLHLAKITNNIPIIIEIRRDLRENPEIRKQLVLLISNALKQLAENLFSNN